MFSNLWEKVIESLGSQWKIGVNLLKKRKTIFNDDFL
jgi:hypothetical protein